MKKFLLFVMMCVCVSIGTWAGTISNDNGWLKLENLQPGDLAKAIEGQYTWTGDANALKSATKVVFGNGVELNDEDLAALKTLIPAATQLDMAKASLKEGADYANLETQAVQYLRLPDGFTEEADVTKMGKLSSKNTALKVVGAYDGSDSTLPELALYSFAENELSNFSSNVMALADKAMVARLAGTYGDKDLVNNGPVFGWTPPCIWDFTGATFSSCTVDPGVSTEYYAYNDPFCLGTASKPSSPHQTNSFFYFSNYSTKVVDIKLPTGITALPPHCLNDLGGDNVKLDAHKAAYKAYYDVTDDDLNGDLKIAGKSAAVIPTLTIPNNYTLLDYECGAAAHIQHLVVGNGVKIVQGGAFNDCLQLEDLDFGAGLSNCYLGDRAFHGQNNSVMKHIALSEGIVSLGYQCFQNAQQLESIRLPQSLKYIGNHSFNNCLALNSITIPENVEKIGQNAFTLCPFTDIYLTTTDPDKIPFIWSAGTGQDFDGFDSRSTFYNSHIFGWSGIPDTPDAPKLAQMTWDEAADYYFTNVNGCPVLHYPSQLAEKVREDISGTYHAHTKADETGKEYRLPLRADMNSRAQIPDCGDSENKGKYTQNGWAQFMLMKAYVTNGPTPEVYQKEYDDVWYTMCFPFDLSDEQLAGAFNETFNIVDFSGVEIKEPTETTGKKLVLHFNNVAITHYKDTEGKIYDRKTDNSGNVIREKDTDGFEYNVYISREDKREYHHAIVSTHLASNKTKTFAPGSACLNLTGQNADKSGVVIIDGILAEAGHPYMIHPAIGVNDGGNNKKNCYFSGIEWLKQSDWAKTFEERKRTVDLGEARGTIDETDYHKSTPDANNYVQAAYSAYAGQKYTFVGNAIEYRADAQAAIGNEPQIPEKPVLATQGDAPNDPSAIVGARLTAADEPQAPEFVANPADDTTTYPANFQTFYNATGGYNGSYDDSNLIWGDAILNWQLSDLVSGPKNWGTMVYSWDHGKDAFKTYFGMSSLESFPVDEYSSYESRFNTLKALCQSYHDKLAAYAQYPTDVANYEAEHKTWQDNVDAWAAYDAAYAEWAAFDPAVAQQKYEDAKDAYEDAIEAHDAWMEDAKKWMTYIPKGSYFLGRRTNAYPKYYRETAENPVEGQASTRSGGVWTQFTAIVTPNDAALNGIEKELDKKQAQSKGFDMAFNEGFLGDFIDVDDPGIVTAIEEARKAGAEVEYMDIVVSINGQVVRRGSTSIEGLPKGVYIINGKKYFVK